MYYKEKQTLIFHHVLSRRTEIIRLSTLLSSISIDDRIKYHPLTIFEPITEAQYNRARKLVIIKILNQ
jgi:hypothetical protein